jgi:hypothetical protein
MASMLQTLDIHASEDHMLRRMRTTLTLDADVAARLKRIQQRQNAPFENVVDAALREGLDALEKRPRPKHKTGTRRKTWTPPLPLGGSLVAELHGVAEVLAIAGGPAFK